MGRRRVHRPNIGVVHKSLPRAKPEATPDTHKTQPCSSFSGIHRGKDRLVQKQQEQEAEKQTAREQIQNEIQLAIDHLVHPPPTQNADSFLAELPCFPLFHTASYNNVRLHSALLTVEELETFLQNAIVFKAGNNNCGHSLVTDSMANTARQPFDSAFALLNELTPFTSLPLLVTFTDDNGDDENDSSKGNSDIGCGDNITVAGTGNVQSSAASRSLKAVATLSRIRAVRSRVRSLPPPLPVPVPISPSASASAPVTLGPFVTALVAADGRDARQFARQQKRRRVAVHTATDGSQSTSSTSSTAHGGICHSQGWLCRAGLCTDCDSIEIVTNSSQTAYERIFIKLDYYDKAAQIHTSSQKATGLCGAEGASGVTIDADVVSSLAAEMHSKHTSNSWSRSRFRSSAAVHTPAHTRTHMREYGAQTSRTEGGEDAEEEGGQEGPDEQEQDKDTEDVEEDEDAEQVEDAEDKHGREEDDVDVDSANAEQAEKQVDASDSDSFFFSDSD